MEPEPPDFLAGTGAGAGARAGAGQDWTGSTTLRVRLSRQGNEARLQDFKGQNTPSKMKEREATLNKNTIPRKSTTMKKNEESILNKNMYSEEHEWQRNQNLMKNKNLKII